MVKGDWINFAELCKRANPSPTTLRRMISNRQISSRQRVRGGKREFNWRTVERELGALEKQSVVRLPAEVDPAVMELLKAIRSDVANLRAEVRASREAVA